MPSNDDESGRAASAAASDSTTTTTFNENFFPESRPPNTITSSVHKKFNLVEAIASHQPPFAELRLMDRILSWTFELLIIGLLIILIHKFIKRTMQDRNAAQGGALEKRRNVKEGNKANKSKPGDMPMAKDNEQKCIVVNQSNRLTVESKPEHRDTLRFKSQDLKCVKKRKWVSTGPIMAHGRDLSLSPDKKLLNLRLNNLLADSNPMFNPLPLLTTTRQESDSAQKKVREGENETAAPEMNHVMEIKLHIPVQVTVENIYNFKNFNVCLLCFWFSSVLVEYMPYDLINGSFHFPLNLSLPVRR